MQAYAVLDGGGVKGAALVGALAAAQKCGIEFIGYGGSSAGAIVALLAAVGHTPSELKHIMVEEGDFSQFLDDSGDRLSVAKGLHDQLRACEIGCNPLKWPRAAKVARKVQATLRELGNELGLYSGNPLHAFLERKIRSKLKIGPHESLTFTEVFKRTRVPLKVVASDLGSRRMVVFDHQKWPDFSVLDAVRASMSYPFVFKPVRFNNSYFVDGGLCSNLPVFLFDDERKQNSTPVFAFDLFQAKIADPAPYGLMRFCADMLATTLEATDDLARRHTQGLYHVVISIPNSINSMDFGLSRALRETLFDRGYTDTIEFCPNIQAYFDAGVLSNPRNIANSAQAKEVP